MYRQGKHTLVRVWAGIGHAYSPHSNGCYQKKGWNPHHLISSNVPSLKELTSSLHCTECHFAGHLLGWCVGPKLDLVRRQNSCCMCFFPDIAVQGASNRTVHSLNQPISYRVHIFQVRYCTFDSVIYTWAITNVWFVHQLVNKMKDTETKRFMWFSRLRFPVL